MIPNQRVAEAQTLPAKANRLKNVGRRAKHQARTEPQAEQRAVRAAMRMARRTISFGPVAAVLILAFSANDTVGALRPKVVAVGVVVTGRCVPVWSPPRIRRQFE